MWLKRSTLTKKKRPFGWRMLLLGFGILAIRSWGRIYRLFFHLNDYQSLEHAPPIVLYFVFNIGVGILVSVVLYGLWRRKSWLPKMLISAIFCVAIGDLWLLYRYSGTGYVRQSISFWGVSWLGIILVVFFLSRRSKFLYYFQQQTKESSYK
ncbi:MAG: hypothetical protein CUN55_02825 [Phototrophicales bacterium]|nr:MAG: hypothetical protein CUN55_02825 [Phototrophicales bacterium]